MEKKVKVLALGTSLSDGRDKLEEQTQTWAGWGGSGCTGGADEGLCNRRLLRECAPVSLLFSR